MLSGYLFVAADVAAADAADVTDAATTDALLCLADMAVNCGLTNQES